MTDSLAVVEKQDAPLQRLGEMELLQLAIQHNAAIDVIERLSALRDKAMERDAEMQFNEAMNEAQAELGRIAPDLTNPQTHSKYASYAALDKKLRPIYTKHGFSLSFNSGDSPIPETVRVVCYVSHRAGHTRTYTGPPMPADGKGAKGGDVMTKTHATGAAMSYGARYLLKYIFNIAVGEEDVDGNEVNTLALEDDVVQKRVNSILAAGNDATLKQEYLEALHEAQKVNDAKAQTAYAKSKNQRYRELHPKGGQ
jgi:hypothetical protein